MSHSLCRRAVPASGAILSLVVGLVLALAPSASAAPARVPCTSIGGGKYNCTFDQAGDGRSGGSPVRSSAGAVVGYLDKGTNYVLCNARGGRVTSGPYFNTWYGYTVADNGRTGWVNAVYAHGGDNDGPFGGGTPTCPASRGLPPGAVASTPSPTPTPTPAPSSGGPRPASCTPSGTKGRFNCFFYPAGDGVSSGTPVEDGARHLVGRLHQGVNYVLCQAVGGEVAAGADHNKNWAWTVADNGAKGWVNALYVSGGDNDGVFGGGTPGCGSSHGAAPAGAPLAGSRPKPSPQPGPAPAPTPPPSPLPVPSGGGAAVRAKILAVGKKQLDRHYVSRDMATNPYGSTTSWCSVFLTWVWRHAGVKIKELAFTGDVYSWGLTHTYTLPPTARPAVGDAVEFGNIHVRQPWVGGNIDNSSHIGIVWQVYPNGMISTLNGNFWIPGGGSSVVLTKPFDPKDTTNDGDSRSQAGRPVYGFVSPVDDRGSKGAARTLAPSSPVPAAVATPRASGDDDLVPGTDPATAATAAAGQGQRGPQQAQQPAPPAYGAMPYSRSGVRISAVDATKKGLIVVQVRYRGSRRAATRVLQRFLKQHHDRASNYRVRYRHAGRR